MRFLRQLLLAFMFMTRIPLPFPIKTEDKDFAAAAMFYPLTSLATGAFMLLFYWLASFLGEALLSAFAAVMAGYLFTGALHLDGFADCCDAFFSKKPREELLRILKDSRLGTFGVLGILVDVGFKTLLLYALFKQRRAELFFAVLCMPVAGKLSLIIAPALAKYAREQGTGKSMIAQMKPLYIIVCMIFASGILALFFGIYAAILSPALILAGIIIALRAKKRLGGITGDVLGAANEAGEMLFLLALLILYTV